MADCLGEGRHRAVCGVCTYACYGPGAGYGHRTSPRATSKPGLGCSSSLGRVPVRASEAILLRDVLWGDDYWMGATR